MTTTQQVSIAVLILAITLPIAVFYMGKRGPKRFKRLLAVNITSFSAALIFATVFAFTNIAHAAEMAEAGVKILSDSAGLAFIGAALSTGMASIGAGIATGAAASAALGAISENEGVMGKALIFVALAEGIAIYGLIIAFMILNRV